MIEEDLITTTEEITETHEMEKPKANEIKGIKGIMAAISAALHNGEINSEQAKRVRSSLGYEQAYFTRKQVPKEKRISKRKAQQTSRRKNRETGKGQKRSG